jgi:hypothetical protein
MKFERLKKRLDKNRPLTTVSIRFPIDVIEDLKRVAPLRGFSGYQPLVRAYVVNTNLFGGSTNALRHKVSGIVLRSRG